MMDRQLSSRDLPRHLEWDSSGHATTISSVGAPLAYLGWNDALVGSYWKTGTRDSVATTSRPSSNETPSTVHHILHTM